MDSEPRPTPHASPHSAGPTMTSVGVAFSDDLINSDNRDHLIARIRRDYHADSTVTLLLLGGWTHRRRFIDWELKASLRQGQNYTPNGLLGVLLPSVSASGVYLPPGFEGHWNPENRDCYARYYFNPTSGQEL